MVILKEKESLVKDPKNPATLSPKCSYDEETCCHHTPKGGHTTVDLSDASRGNVSLDGLDLHPEGALVAPDGGWGWMVAIGSFIVMMLIPMLFPCFGILFSGYLLESGASSMTTAWIFNIQGFIWNIMGILARPLGNEFGWRCVGFISVTLVSTSLIVSAFATSPVFLFFSLSLLSGIGGGLSTSMCFLMVPKYFDSKRGMGNAIMMVGICLGEILGPLLVRFLLDEYSFQGATLIIGAILLNSYIGISFFHPVEWHSKRLKNQKSCSCSESTKALLKHHVDTDKSDLLVTLYDKDLNRNKLETFWQQESLLCKDQMKNMETVTFAIKKTSTMQSQTKRSSLAEYQIKGLGAEHSEINRSSTFNSQMLYHDSMMSASLRRSNSGSWFTNLPDGIEEKLQKSTSSAVTQRNLEKYSAFRLFQSTFADLGILKSPKAAVIAVGNMLCMNSTLNFVMMVPFAMQALDYSLQESAWCISVSAICNLMTRMVVSPMSDWSRFSMKLFYIGGYAALAISMLAFPLVSELRWLEVVMGLFGSALGANMALYNLMMIEYMGVENLAPVFGASGLMVGVGFLFFGTLSGLIRDVSGSYAVSMWMLSAMAASSFLLWLLMPTAVAYEERLKERANERLKEGANEGLKERANERLKEGANERLKEGAKEKL